MSGTDVSLHNTHRNVVFHYDRHFIWAERVLTGKLASQGSPTSDYTRKIIQLRTLRPQY